MAIVIDHITDEDGITTSRELEVELDDFDPDVEYCLECGFPIQDGSEFDEVEGGKVHASYNCMSDHEPDIRDTETNFGGYSTGWGDDTPTAYDDYYDGGDF